MKSNLKMMVSNGSIIQVNNSRVLSYKKGKMKQNLIVVLNFTQVVAPQL
jgi:hypothetical protein